MPDSPIELGFLEPTNNPEAIGKLSHYEILQVLGHGGFGIVLKAFDEKLHRFVAIKVLNPQLAVTSPPRKRFLREARAAAAIKHENIVQVYSVEEQPLPYLVMEYVNGVTLQKKLDRTGPLGAMEIANLGRQIAKGLAAAHALDLIHRDIKPENILIESGAEQQVKITDFGLARAVDDASMTRTGVVSGTPMYMAPEQASGQALDHRADLFSCGSVLYRMACGRPPFRAATTIAVLRRVVEDTPRPLQEILPEIPSWLVAIVSKLHAKNPDHRFQSAKELADLLARCQSELEQHGRVDSLGDLSAEVVHPKIIERSIPTKAIRRKPVPRGLPWVAALTVIIASLLGLGLTEASGLTNLGSTVVRLFSPDGILIVEVDDPGESVRIDGEEVVITGAGAKEIRLKPGQYKIQASKDGKVVRQELVTVQRNGRQVMRMSKEAIAHVDAPAVSDAKPILESKLPRKFANTLGMEFALIPKGKSWLGGSGGQPGTRAVEFDDFYLGIHPITQSEWTEMMGSNPSQFCRAGAKAEAVQDISDAELKRFPVEFVSWEETQVFLDRLNEQHKESGWTYRLPTESEWEYACRAGPMNKPQPQSAFDFYFGKPSNDLLVGQANFGQGDPGRTCAVGSYQPNALGLHDMHGNVHTWCLDRIPATENSLPTTQRVLRAAVIGPLRNTAALPHVLLSPQVTGIATSACASPAYHRRLLTQPNRFPTRLRQCDEQSYR